jgi:serine/threonine protein kinase
VTPEAWKRVKSVLAEALERPGEERPAFLDSACAQDPGLRAEVESLLSAAASPVGSSLAALSDFLDTSNGARLVAQGIASLVAPDAPQREDLALVGQVLDGKYRLERLLGEGGMGAVYLATHLGTDRPVALKLIAPVVAGRAEFVERFRREARAAGRLRHPGVVDVTDFGVATIGAEPFPYIVMEYLDGCTLADVLWEERRLPLPWVVDIIEQACSAVHEAHMQGIVHRDLKPANLWLEPNRRGGFTVKVLDFGLAKRAEASRPQGASPAAPLGEAGSGVVGRPLPSDSDETLARSTTAGAAVTGASEAGLTRVGDVLGTPLYMSPEQCCGLPLDARSDVYSLGVIAYRLIAGTTPFSGDARTVLEQHVSAVPPPVRAGQGDVPESLGELLASALAKDPAQRPRSAVAFATALRARSEGAGPLLQRLVVLLGERYPVLLRLSALGHLPLASAALAFAATGQWFVPLATVRWPVLLSARGVLAVSIALSGLATSALCEAVVLRSLVEPLRPVAVLPLLAGLRRRAPAYVATLAPFVALGPYLVLVLLLGEGLGLGRVGTLLLAGPVIAALLWALLNLRGVLFLSSVIHVEGLSGRAALARSAELARRAVRRLPAVGQAALLTALLAGPVWAALASGASQLEVLAARLGWSLGPVTIAGLAGLLATPFLVLGMPIFGVAASLLYFRTREADGESLAEMLERFESEVPAPAWRSRLEERVRERIRSGA